MENSIVCMYTYFGGRGKAYLIKMISGRIQQQTHILINFVFRNNYL